MHNAMIENMRTDALHDLYAGYVTPLDREILADMPLPSDMVDPFASQDVEPLSVMNLTYVSLSGWIAEAKKEKYYSERFVSLSKLVMKGVTTMGRGLVTLHQRGEDLSAAPMQIDDLISVGSYHFRKSYLGVVQFSAKHPEIGERLLVNQLGWSTTLLRLYKTKEKLESGIRSQVSGVSSNDEGRTLQNEEGSIQNEELRSNAECGMRNAELPSDSGCEISNTALDDRSALSAVSALFEPAAFSAQRALTSLTPNKKSETLGNKKSEIRNKKYEEVKTADNEEIKTKNEEVRTKNDEPADCADHPADRKSSEISGKGTEEYSLSTENKAEAVPVRFETEKSSSETSQSENYDLLTDENLPLITEIPETVKIMQNVMRRSKDEKDGMLTFTIDEMRVLAADPIFAEMEPELTADIRNALVQFDSG